MARLRYNGLSATLGGSLTSSATSVTFGAALTHSNGTNVPTIAGSDYIPLAILDASGHLSEIVYLTAYTAAATTGTVTRGQEGTSGVAHSSGDKIIQSPTVADVNVGVLASVDYNPGTITSYSTTSSTVTDLDATNLAVTFVAPASGIVIVTLTALVTAAGGGGNYLTWALRESTTTVKTRYIVGSTNGDNLPGSAQFRITGLTSGSSHTYKWAQFLTGSGTANTHAGGIAGAAVMKVEAA